jgi:hypothetical protein
MSHPGRWPRLAAYLGLIAAGLYVAFALAHGLGVWHYWHDVARWGRYTPTAGGGTVFWHAVALPLANEPVGSFVDRWGRASPYTAPGELFSALWSELSASLVMLLIMHASCGLSFAALPITRRRCKVRWAHIVRVTLYGYVLVVPAVVLSVAAMPMTMAEIPAGALVAPLAAVAWGALPLLAVIWWTAAARRYLRMPHAWGVGLAVTVIGILLPPAIGVLIAAALGRF